MGPGLKVILKSREACEMPGATRTTLKLGPVVLDCKTKANRVPESRD